MKLKDNFILREISGRKVMIPSILQGKGPVDVVSLSSSSAWLIERLKGVDFSEQSAATIVCEAFEVDREVALEDIREMVSRLKEAGYIE